MEVVLYIIFINNTQVMTEQAYCHLTIVGEKKERERERARNFKACDQVYRELKSSRRP